ncbi:hypothetical protein [Thermoplasma acidophilum]|uniref:hypothetical protein n=1 Tax=Thermoplasma acidophilum TaxID=2303 RepID=UPI0012EA9817|nr:hypothetical protein [Thermoplasma acidophilum]
MESLRMIGGIREKTPGHFYYKRKNIIHFHVDGSSVFADVGNDRILVNKENYADIIQVVLSYMKTLE